MRHQVVFIVFVNLLVLASLLVTGYTRFQDFRNYHEAIAEETTSQVANTIFNFIKERKRLVRLFVKENQASIQQYANDVYDEAAYKNLSKNLRDHFPDYFAFTIARPDGQLLVDDFDGYIGDICQGDIMTFSKGLEPTIRVHPNPHIYHFDMMAEYAMEQQGIFFVSFPADLFGELIQPAEVTGHSVYLLFREGESKLIEASSAGSRIRIDRPDYRFQPGETTRILRKADVVGTNWEVVDLHNEKLFSKYITELVAQLGIILFISLLASTLVYMRIRSIEEQRLEAERHKDEFFSLMSHEFRTPLTAIIGAIKLMKSGATGKMSQEADEMVNIALGNSDRMLLLVNDILDVQKMQIGKMEFVYADVLLATIVEKAVNNISNVAEQNGVNLVVKPVMKDIVLRLDENRITQAVTNLLSNAIKYGAEHDSIEVQTGVSDEKNCAFISVTDHGEGIPAEDQARIFNKFIMLKQYQRNIPSSGLGLTVVKLIVIEHGGDVSVKSQPGETVFTISLPLAHRG